LTVLFIETLTFSALVSVWAMSSRQRAKRVYKEAMNLSPKEWLLFLLFAGVGLLGAYASDAAVLSHGVHSIQLGSIAIGLGLTSGLYMFSVDRQKALKSIPWLLGLIVSAVGLVNSKA
jgi:ABC-type multidrug transport system fused ATPase/permease subunit